MLGPGDLREELRLQVSHPGDDAGFCRGGFGAVDHPEKQPSLSPAWQSAQHRTGKKKCHISCLATLWQHGEKIRLLSCYNQSWLLYSLVVICGCLLPRRGQMHSAAHPTWRVWCRCTKTYEGKDWSSPWQNWMVTHLAKPQKRYKRGWCAHRRYLGATYDLWSFSFGVISVPLLARLCLGTGLLSLLCLLCSYLPNLRSSHPRLLS